VELGEELIETEIVEKCIFTIKWLYCNKNVTYEYGGQLHYPESYIINRYLRNSNQILSGGVFYVFYVLCILKAANVTAFQKRTAPFSNVISRPSTSLQRLIYARSRQSPRYIFYEKADSFVR
jgi:hypothetical protein